MNLLIDILLGLLFVAALGWVAWHWMKRSPDDPGWLVSKWILTALLFTASVLAVLWIGPFGMAVLVPCCIVMGCLWAPNMGLLLAKPLTSLYEGGHLDHKPEPMYSIAEARRKHGDYEGALRELRRQLEKFPNHFKVQLAIAEIQAQDMLDLASAEQTIETILAQPGHPPGELAIALHCLSDWRLRLAHDRAAARAALERVLALFPNSEQARMAEQRLAHLPSQEMLAASWDRPDVALPAGEPRVGLRQTPLDIAPKEEPAPETAARLVRQLEIHPNDIEARGQLALVYANHYQRLDLALEQLEQLVADPHQPQRLVVHWFNLMADLHIRLAGDPAAAGASLDRISERFPGSAAAEAASNRKVRLKLELRAKKESQVVKLGSYGEIGIRARR